MMDYSRAFAKGISDNHNECLIYCADNLSQFTRAKGHVRSKCDRALAVARAKDIVVLRGLLEPEYQNFLRSLGLGTDNIVEYKSSSHNISLSRLIINNPDPVNNMIQEIEKKPVYVPWFSGDLEALAAKSLHADLFGAPFVETMKYNDKAVFKKTCCLLGIKVIEDTILKMNLDNDQNLMNMKRIIQLYLGTHTLVLIRGCIDDTGVSMVFRTKGDDINALFQKIMELGMDKVLIEPLLKVVSSPNDQWIITRDKKIIHTGILDQVLKDMMHIGNLKSRELFIVEKDYIFNTSLQIVQRMKESGYIGVVGIDYIITKSGIYPVENNARFNGSSYVKIIVDNIEELTGPVFCWKSIKAKTSPVSFNTLARRLKPILFDGLKPDSVFPYNCDYLEKTGDFAVILLARDLNEIAVLEEKLRHAGVG